MPLHIINIQIMSKVSILNASISNSISRHLVSTCSGRADLIGSEANLPGRRGLIGDKLTALGQNHAAIRAMGTGSAAEAVNSPIQKLHVVERISVSLCGIYKLHFAFKVIAKYL